MNSAAFNLFPEESPPVPARGPTLLTANLAYSGQPMNFQGAIGRLSENAPATREVLVIATRHLVPAMPLNVFGLYLRTDAPPTVLGIKMRQAIFSSDGDLWMGSSTAQTATPKARIGTLSNESTGVTIANMRTNAGDANFRALRYDFSAPTLVAPQQVWVLTAIEALYTSDVNSGYDAAKFGSFAEVVGSPHKPAGTSAFPRNLIWKDALTVSGGIDNFLWSSVEDAPDNWLVSPLTSVTLNTGETLSAGGPHIITTWGWELIIGR